jgi:hypothetical protein
MTPTPERELAEKIVIRIKQYVPNDETYEPDVKEVESLLKEAMEKAYFDGKIAGMREARIIVEKNK